MEGITGHENGGRKLAGRPPEEQAAFFEGFLKEVLRRNPGQEPPTVIIEALQKFYPQANF